MAITHKLAIRIEPSYHGARQLQFWSPRDDDFVSVISGIFIAPLGVAGRLRGFIEQITAAGVSVSIVVDIAQLTELVESEPHAVPCIGVDLSHGFDRSAVAAFLDRVSGAVPGAPMIAITDGADGGLVIACLRGGAADVIDLRFDQPDVALPVIERACRQQLERLADHEASQETLAAHRSVLGEMLKDLIQTERRKLDLEFELAKLGKGPSDLPPAPDLRAPAAVIIDRDRAQAQQLATALERLGVTVVSYATGAEAVREVMTLMRWGTMLDLAVVSGADALEPIRGLRGLFPGLSSVLLTAAPTAAADAAEGIVWTTPAPIKDMPAVSKRLAQLASDALVKTREQAYLENIKARHERVLARYRALPR